MKRVTNAKTWETALNHLENEMGYSHLWKRLAAIEDILSDENGEYDLDLIAELVKAKRDGRCVILPCKIGGKLYSAFPLCGVNSHQIRKFEINKDGMFACSALMIPFFDVGKTVFLTREAAEEALKEYKDGQKNS